MKRVHRAWAVCLGCTVMLLVCSGLAVNAFSVAQPYILSENGFTNTQTSSITTVRYVTYILSMFLVNWYYRKLGYRLGMTLAAVLSAAAFALYAVARSLVGYYLGSAVAGLGVGFGSMVPATILTMRWFSSHQAMALGICSAGTGFATVIFAPILTRLITGYSLRVCFWAEAGVMLAAAALVFLLIRQSPQSCGCQPYGTAKKESPQALALHEVHPSRLRWVMLYLSMAFLGAIAAPGFSHMMILFTTAGFSGAQASAAVSLFGFMLMAGKCVFGVFCDRFGTPRTNWIFGVVLLGGLLLCVLVHFYGAPLMYLCAALYGAGVPLNTVGMSVWAADFSPAELVSRRVQRFQLFYALGCFIFSFMPGIFADLTGSYAPSYIVFFLFGAFALLTVQSTYRLGSRTKAGV